MDNLLPFSQDSGPSESASEVPIVSSASYEPAGAEAEHDALTGYLHNTAATVTIQNAMDLAIDAMALQPGDRALDVGCGPGDFLPRMAEAVGPRGLVSALDHAPGFLDEARALVAGLALETPIDYIQGDALALPYPDNSFDAAHTERVLIHLSDPDRSLRELYRVLRPGGWVVCVEPDLVGMRIDHERPAIAKLLVASFTETIRFPAMGLELNRRLAAAGFVDRSIQTLTEVDRTFDEGAAAIFGAGAHRMVADGRLSAVDAESALSWLSRQSVEGRYTSYTSMFIVAGRVPV